MTSPVGNRRRQRSTRIVVGVLLLLLAACAVAGTAITGSWPAVTAAGAVAVLFGAAATKIMHSELRASRRDAARDRAELAQEYRAIAEVRGAENLDFVADMQGRLAKRDATVSRLEKRLRETAQELADARRELAETQDRAELAERESTRLGERLADAEERAMQAVVRVAELEHEVEVLTAEWQAAQAAANVRKPA